MEELRLAWARVPGGAGAGAGAGRAARRAVAWDLLRVLLAREGWCICPMPAAKIAAMPSPSPGFMRMLQANRSTATATARQTKACIPIVAVLNCG